MDTGLLSEIRSAGARLVLSLSVGKDKSGGRGTHTTCMFHFASTTLKYNTSLNDVCT